MMSENFAAPRSQQLDITFHGRSAHAGMYPEEGRSASAAAARAIAEMRLGRRAALHADYRYTFLRFGAADPIKSDTIAGAIAQSHLAGSSSGARFLPSYEGSMWTTGLTIYF